MFKAESREITTTGALRQNRKNGKVPGIIYGGGKESQPLFVCRKALEKSLQTKAFFSQVHDLSLDGTDVKALVRQISFHSVTDVPTHIDFLRIVKGQRAVLSIPLVFQHEDKCPGLKKGGVLNIVVKSLHVSVLPEEAPASISISLSGIEAGQSVHLSDIKLPDSLKVLRMAPRATIATILAPSGLDDKEETSEESTANSAA